MPGPTALVDLATIKTHLDITTTSDEAELVRFIARATPIIESLAGPVVQRTITDEQHVGGSTRIALLQRPVVSVTSATEYLGTTSRTVTVAATPAATTTYGATLDTAKGVLTRWITGAPQTWASVVWVTYVAGRTSVPANIEHATLELVRHMWETQRGSQSGPPDLDAATGGYIVAGYAVPNRVVEMLGDQARLDGFA